MTPETEAKLNKLAERTHRGKDELLEEAVNQLVAYNDWFEQKVRNSLAAAERGETVPDEEVRAWVERDTQFPPVNISGEPPSKTVLRERR